MLIGLSWAGAALAAAPSEEGEDVCDALPVVSCADDAAAGGGASGAGTAADGGSLPDICAFSSPACCLSKAAAAKATKNKASILIK